MIIFHLANLLVDETGKIIICDWQGLSVGKGSGDLSFFLSRLCADGVQLDAEEVIRLYAEEVFALTGNEISQESLIYCWFKKTGKNN